LLKPSQQLKQQLNNTEGIVSKNRIRWQVYGKYSEYTAQYCNAFAYSSNWLTQNVIQKAIVQFMKIYMHSNVINISSCRRIMINWQTADRVSTEKQNSLGE